MSTPQEGAIRVRIVGHASAASLVGDRVYHLSAPPRVDRPYIIYGRTGGGPVYHYGGEGYLRDMRIAVTGFADTSARMVAVEQLIRNALSGFRGPVTVDATTVHVRRLHIVEEADDVIPPPDGKSLPIYRTTKQLEMSVYSDIPSL